MKKIVTTLATLLAFVMLANSAFAADFMYGDGDNDSLITSTDAALTIQHSLNLTYLKSLDVNGDGALTSTDAALIIKKVLNGDYIFPVEDMTESTTETTTSSSSDDDTATTEKETEISSEDVTESTTETTTSSSSDDDTTTTEKETEISSEDITETTTETVDINYNKTWTMSDSGFNSLGEINNTVEIDGLKLIAISTKTMQIAAANVTVGDKTYTHRLALGGSGKTTERAVSFDVKGNTTIEVVAQSSGSADRTLNVVNSDGAILKTITAPSSAASGKVTISYTGIVYIYSAGSGIHIYEVKRTSSGSSSETTTETSTESTSEASTETTTSSTDPNIDNSEYNVQGFASVGLSDLNTSGYTVYEVSDAASFLTAIDTANKNGNAIIKVTQDLNLGSNEVSGSYSCFKPTTAAILHPDLIKSGISQITIKGKNIVIYSPNGNAIKHTNIVLSDAQNIVFRNLTFSELWEWDEYSFGHYDRNDWDYICIQGASKNVWIDHCTFKKSYDGIVDSKAGSSGVSVTWSKFESDKAFVKKQIDYLESHINDTGSSITITNNTGEAIDCLGLTESTSSQTTNYKYALYRYLRLAVGLTTEEIIEASLPQQKSNLIGASELASDNKDLEVTLAYNWYENSRDRMPRLRGGNAHVYNTVIDSSTINNVYNKHKAALNNVSKISGVTGDNKTEKFDFSTTSQAFVTTEDGALAVENCVVKGTVSPVKNNQKSASKAEYTGKFKATNVLLDGTLTSWDGSQTAIDSDTNNKLYPVGADPKVFSWNTTNNFGDKALTYTAIDPTVLEEKLSGKTGAGVVNLDWTTFTYNN